ncbi:MAG: flagellar basal body rod protein FlgB [Alphaproteobacteria bacterium]|nr:flagellar basal body rod protein FlgB [Alphaproteobacteria bacterium]
MDFSKLPLADMMGRKLEWLRTRSAILAENVANADTPGYEARDLKPLDFKTQLRRAGSTATAATLAVTNAHHIAATPGPTSAQLNVAKEQASIETTLSGNSVNLEQQMGKVGETQLAYHTVVELYRKHLSMIRTALGRSGV